MSKVAVSAPVEIVIERREEIARIVEDPYGDRPMIALAWMAATEYVSEHAQEGESLAVEFGFGPHTFRVSADPR